MLNTFGITEQDVPEMYSDTESERMVMDDGQDPEQR